MTRFVFDIETDGLLDTLTKVHCLVLSEIDTGEVFSFGPKDIETGVRMLMEADLICGHNIIKFDVEALKKVYPWFSIPEDKVLDTLVLSRLIWSDVADKDYSRIRAGKSAMPMKLAGSHSLEAWGWRLGKWKGDYAKVMADLYLDACHLEGLPKTSEEEVMRHVWANWSEDMQSYCETDVEVTLELYNLIQSKDYSEEAIKLEHEVAWICAQQERNGFGFNVAAAEKLYHELTLERVQLEEELRSLFEPWQVPGKPKTYKRRTTLKTGQVVEAGETHTPMKTVVFNPGSRDHIADRLINVRSWKPTELTESGKPKVDESVLGALPYAEAKQLAKYFQVKKVLGQLADGDKSWLKFATNGRIHGSINPNGAVTGRATHSFPNLAQVPSSGAYRGKDCRALFGPLYDTHVQLGCDVSGLELRMLAHFMAKYDDGEYGRQVVEGDVHWVNVQALGLVPDGTIRDEAKFVVHKVFRDGTKTFIYGFLYGAGDEKVGTLVLEIAAVEEDKTGESSVRAKYFGGKRKIGSRQLKQVGRKLKADFLDKLPALKQLVTGVKKAANTKGYLTGLDGRQLHVRSDHAALNVLLQSAGALVCKKWLVEFHKLLREKNLHNVVFQMAWVHDEVQLSIPREYTYVVKVKDKNGDERDELRSEIGDLCIEAIKRAGEYFQIRVPLDGEYKIGNSWKECH